MQELDCPFCGRDLTSPVLEKLVRDCDKSVVILCPGCECRLQVWVESTRPLVFSPPELILSANPAQRWFEWDEDELENYAVFGRKH